MKPEPFTTVSGLAAAMPEENIDTDIIFPARFLLLTQREGLGVHAFHDRRFREDGSEVADYVLNTAEFRTAPVIVAGTNFGSGSSREQAVWALAGRGVKVVIAPTLGEIFAGNCLRNGLLPITLDPSEVDLLLAAAARMAPFTIDLERQTITAGDLAPIAFGIAPERKQALLMGWDETDEVIGRFSADIAAFEAAQRRSQPWLYPAEPV